MCVLPGLGFQSLHGGTYILSPLPTSCNVGPGDDHAKRTVP